VLPVAVVDLGGVLAGLLDEQRHPHDPGVVAVADDAGRRARGEADAVVGRDHHHGLVEQATLAHGGQRLAQQPVGEGKLEPVPPAAQFQPGGLVVPLRPRPGHARVPGGDR
jgi:hypothetical protein